MKLNFIRIIVIIIFGISVITSVKKGFVRSILDFLSIIIAFFVAKTYTPFVSDYISENIISKSIGEFLKNAGENACFFVDKMLYFNVFENAALDVDADGLDCGHAAFDADHLGETGVGQGDERLIGTRPGVAYEHHRLVFGHFAKPLAQLALGDVVPAAGILFV